MITEEVEKLKSERNRVHIPHHERSLELQMLDVMLRIEEALEKQLEGLRHIAKALAGQKVSEEAPKGARGKR